MSRIHMNQVLLQGNLADKPDMKKVGAKGASLATFTVVTNKEYVHNGAKKESTQYTKCCAWGWVSETCTNLDKGDLVTVIGEIQTRSWENKDGVRQYTTEVNASSVARVDKGASFGTPGRASKEDSGPPRRKPVNPTKGGWPFKDVTTDISWPAPEDGYSVTKDSQGLAVCCGWFDPTDPEKGGEMFYSDGGKWVKSGVVPELANRF